MNEWSQLFERVIVPLTGLVIVVLAARGTWPVPIPLYPLLGGMIGLPVLRYLDTKRREGNGEK